MNDLKHKMAIFYRKMLHDIRDKKGDYSLHTWLTDDCYNCNIAFGLKKGLLVYKQEIENYLKNFNLNEYFSYNIAEERYAEFCTLTVKPKFDNKEDIMNFITLCKLKGILS